MARHNLAGWCRDVQSLLRTGTDEELEQFFALWVDVEERVEDWLDVGHRKDSSDVESTDDDAYDTTDDNQGDVDGDELEEREADAPRARRHDARSEALRAAPSGLGRVLENVPGRVRGSAEPEQLDLRDVPLGAPLGCLTRQPAAPPEPARIAGNRAKVRPAPTRRKASVRKGRANGTAKKRRR